MTEHKDPTRTAGSPIYERLLWIGFGALLGLVLALGRAAISNGAELVDLSPAEQSEIRNLQSAIPAQCPGGVCPQPGGGQPGSWGNPLRPQPYQRGGYPREIPVPPPRRTPQPQAPPSAAVPQLPAEIHDAVCRINMAGGNAGSGTLVEIGEDGSGIVATCAHLGSGPCTVTFRNGSQAQGEAVVDRDQQDIGAVILQTVPAGIGPVPIGEIPPPPGTWVVACGYGSGSYACQPNRVLRLARFRGGESLEMQGQFRSGDSGGAIFDARGELVGIINASQTPGAGYVENVATTCRPLKGFLQRVRDKFGFRGRRKETPRPGDELAPGIRVPEVEQDAGCACDNTPVLEKLDALIATQKTQHEALIGNLTVASQTIQAEAAAEKKERTGLAGKIDDLKKRLGTIATREDVGAVAGEQSSVKSEIRNLKSEIFSRAPAAGWTAGKLLAGALGVSTPVGLGIAVAGWLAGRRLKKKLAAGGNGEVGTGNAEVAAAAAAGCAASAITSCGKGPCERVPEKVRVERVGNNETQSRPVERTVILETPPPPQHVIERGQQYVPYQAPSPRLEALERAMAEYVRRNPSAAAVFETVDAYAKQFEAGNK